MQRDHALQEGCLGARDVPDRLPWHWLGQEADEVAGVARLQSNADLACGLETADPRPVPGTRVDDDERTLPRVDLHAARRNDPGQDIVDGARQLAAVDHELGLELQDVGRSLGIVRRIVLAALSHHIEEQDRALKGIGPVFGDVFRREPWIKSGVRVQQGLIAHSRSTPVRRNRERHLPCGSLPVPRCHPVVPAGCTRCAQTPIGVSTDSA